MTTIITINGRTFSICGNGNVVITSRGATVDGYNVDIGDVGKCPNVTIEGNCGTVTCGGSATVNGSVIGNIDCGGSCQCGDVGGNVDAGGSVQVGGSVRGDIDAGGSVTVGQRIG